MMSEQKPIKGWLKLLEAGKKSTEHNIDEDLRNYPLRRQFRPSAPNIAKPSLKRDFEAGLVYYIGDEIEQDRALCGLDRKPPTAHLFKDAVEKKRIILEEAGVMKKLGYDKKKGLFEY